VVQPSAQHTSVVSTLELENSRSGADHCEALRVAGMIADVDELTRMRIEPAFHEAQSQAERAQRQWLERDDLTTRGVRNPHGHTPRLDAKIAAWLRLAEQDFAFGDFCRRDSGWISRWIFDATGQQFRFAGSAASGATAVGKRDSGGQCRAQHILAGRHLQVMTARLDVNVEAFPC
jgi:hypothetical protein